MIRVEASRVIARPIEDVWAYLADLDNLPSWDPGLVHAKWQAPLRSGTRIEMHDASPVLRLASRIVPPVFTVTDFEDGRSFALGLSRGATSMKTVYALEALSPSTTRVTRSFTFDGRGIWTLLELAMRRRAIRDREAEVENLKHVLEQAGPTSWPSVTSSEGEVTFHHAVTGCGTRSPTARPSGGEASRDEERAQFSRRMDP